MKFEIFKIFKIWIDLRVGKHTVSENATFSSVSDDMSLQNLLSLPALDALALSFLSPHLGVDVVPIATVISGGVDS